MSQKSQKVRAFTVMCRFGDFRNFLPAVSDRFFKNLKSEIDQIEKDERSFGNQIMQRIKNYEDKNIINRFQIIKKDSIQNDLIQHAREKEFKVVYTDYSAHKLQFLSGGSPNFVEFYSNPYTGWKRLAKVRDYTNFAVFVPEGKNQVIYETHLKNNKISCNREKIKKLLA